MDVLLKWLVVALLATRPPQQPPPLAEGQSLRFMATSAALTHHLPPSLVHRVVEIESAWNPRAIKYEPKVRAATIGLMQIFPSTAGLSAAQLFKPEANLTAGCRYLAACIRAAGGSIRRGLICYNGGAGCLKKRCPSAENYAQLFNIK